MIQAWEELTYPSETAWNFLDKIRFRPSTNPQDWPGINEPFPSATYAIGHIYSLGIDQVTTLENDLNQKTLKALQKCTHSSERLYVLDWQHPCYWLYPHREFDSEKLEAWAIPVFPNGDYYIFLAEDFRFGIFGHPWEMTICVYGEPLLNAFSQHQPLLFTQTIRKNGQVV